MLTDQTNVQRWRRTPPGVRELKHKRVSQMLVLTSRTPPGVRELKRFAELYDVG